MDRVIIDGKTVVIRGVVIGMDEGLIARDLQRIGDHFIDAISGRNREGKTAEENISQLSINEWDN